MTGVVTRAEKREEKMGDGGAGGTAGRSKRADATLTRTHRCRKSNLQAAKGFLQGVDASWKRENFLTHANERETRGASRGDMLDGKAKASKMHQSHLSDSRKALRVRKGQRQEGSPPWLQAPVQPGPTD